MSESYFELHGAAAMAQANDTWQWGSELSCDGAPMLSLRYAQAYAEVLAGLGC